MNKRLPHLVATALLLARGLPVSEAAPPMPAPAIHPESPPRHTNRLAREKSPYLLQHAHNPVDWYPWGEEAFAKARKENKPIFLSIGYSTCHWCHVMERESFENETVAAFLNQNFVSIKVDREERPDVDKIYMTFVQATTGSGGWPMTVFMTADRVPFFGGTYFPPENRHGRPGFLELLQHVHDAWKNKREDIERDAARISERLGQALRATAAADAPALSADLLRRAGQQMKEMFDGRHGGFGDAPKFPQPSQPEFLLRYAKRFGDQEAERMVLETCAKMADGGIHDQLGGGFARYSVDAQWLVPHFEKMLYDNAQLLDLYLDAYLVSGNARHARTARDIIAYVLRDMTDPEGGFYSAEDADSEGHEGKFYCWTREELKSLLSQDEFKVAVRYFGITEQGNFVDHSHPEPLPHQNVLSVVDPDLNDKEQALLKSAQAKMFKARSKRIRPRLDDKVLTSWNGLMLGSLARAHAILGDESYREAAEKNLAFVRNRLWDAKTRTLHHRWRDGERDKVQLLDDHAFLLEGVLNLYEATLEPGHLEFAIELADAMLSRFYDAEAGGFWLSGPDATDLLHRVKEDYDGAEPSGNSVATLSLLRLAAITDNARYRDAADKTLQWLTGRMQNTPQAVPRMLQALDFWLQEPNRVVVSGDPNTPEGRALLSAVHSVYQPHKVVLGTLGPVEDFARTLGTNDVIMAFLCTGTECKPPTQKAEELKRLLR